MRRMKITNLLLLGLGLVVLVSLGCTSEKTVPVDDQTNAGQSNPHTQQPNTNPSSGSVANPHTKPGPVANPHMKPGAGQLPAGHPPIGGRAAPPRNTGLPAGHPPIGSAQPKRRPALPAGHPPVAGSGAATPKAPTQGMILRPTGPGSVAELARVEKIFAEGPDRTAFQDAFRRVFHVDRRQRDPVGATQQLESLQGKYPKAAAVYRVLGYAAVDNGFQFAKAISYYNKAVELDPNYGEVHYALAFMMGAPMPGSDRARGAVHYKKAIELGVGDPRGIGQRFYPELVK
ncbi:MAG: hypothetical protein CMH54_02645 [Myxococcales bacterium]|nr:hypothetical protein [Myxococcales bacterium]